MIDKTDISALVKAVSRVVKDYVSLTLTTLTGRLDELDARIKAIPAGPQGPPGEKGEPGLPGESIKGEKGDRGEPGEKGEPGERGPDGVNGKDGVPGESIKGERGETGPVGPKGDPGPQGEAGAPGIKGEPGDRGERGEKGLDGKDGRDGRDGIGKDGRDGIDGKDGRDALQIDILPGIDDAKTYQRGTFACHKGGTVYFTGREWLCVARGIDFETDELSEDFRTRTRKTFYTDGTVKEYSWRIPAMLYREGFKDGTEYTRGDVVNYDNSSWICVVDSTKAKPFPSNLSDKPQDWRLMVRKGGNGKDGAPGIQGPPGKDFTPANGSRRQ